MDAIQDFEDLLQMLSKHHVRYLIIGGLAFIYHAKPRYTKDMDIWIDSSRDNIQRANAALVEFGSPRLLNPDAKGARFATAWKNRLRGQYGKANANWIDLNSLIRIKSHIDHPRHQEDVRVLREVKRRLKREQSK